MTHNDTNQPKPLELRRRPVTSSRRQHSAGSEPSGVTPSRLGEPEIYQIELEEQNAELRRTQEELAASRERYFELFDLAPVGYLTINTKGLILEANLTAANLVGVDRSKLVRRSLTYFIFPGDRVLYSQHWRRLAGTDRTDVCELRLRSKRGALIWVRLQSVLAQDNDGAQICRITLSDITERKQAEDAQWKREEQFRASADSMLDGFSIWSAVRDASNQIIDFRLDFINEVGCRLSKGTSQELIGRTLSSLSSWIWNWCRLRDYVLVVETGQPLMAEAVNPDEGCEASKATDRAFDIQVVKSGDGLAILSREVTQRKYAEMLLLQAKEAAEEAKREQQARRRIAERRRQSAESLATILASLNSNEPLEEIMQLTARQARQLFGSQAAAVYGQNQYRDLVMVASEGLPKELTKGVTGDLSILREAVAARKPIALSQVEPGLDSADRGTPEALTQTSRISPDSRYRALLATPIPTEVVPYGAILFHYSEPRRFSDEELELAAAFGSQIALVIENARLRDELGRAAVTAERSRLARDLHDSVTQTLFTASIIAEAIPRVWDRHPREGRAALEELRELTRGALAEMRALLFELRPGALEEKSMGELLLHLTAVFARQIQAPIRLSVTGDDALTPPVKIALYRIAQEALNNVAKHASAREIKVKLRCRAGRVVFRISDDGVGFDPRKTRPGHMGLGIMSERAASIGATLEINNRSVGGTEVVVTCSAPAVSAGAQSVAPNSEKEDTRGG